ncbi:hypothetical protein [Halomarina oriensis]|uniref:Uncharacterized protein n=1 Tax=Halomarina oriensis TaxID=671145 RepID=A0A6B0GLF8_9EURY|nr:hypothetical protein [Halomarina oriensis]MWG34547.1 hypothetical protein [Halomarina oriensis]
MSDTQSASEAFAQNPSMIGNLFALLTLRDDSMTASLANSGGTTGP